MRSWCFHDRNVEPALSVEDRRRCEAANPRLNGVEIIVEVEKYHRCFAFRERIGLTVEHDSLLFVQLAACGINCTIVLRVLKERDVAAGTSVQAVEERKEEILGIWIVGLPILENHVGLAFPRAGTRLRRLPLHDLHANADRSEIRL